MDIYGVVNNVAFLRLLEEARVDLIWHLGPSGDGLLRGGYVIVRHEIEYKRPLVHRPEPIQIEMWVSALQAATLAIEYEVKDGAEICALASTTMAPYDYDRRFPRRFTAAETEYFQRYLDARRAIGRERAV
jgi:acyl-CoA thioester hydrolase